MEESSEPAGRETTITNEKSVELITAGISADLVLDTQSNHSDTQGAASVVDLTKTASIPVHPMTCRDVRHSLHRHRTHLLPMGYTQEPAPLRRVKFDEHNNTHEIEIEDHGKVTINYVNYESERQMKDIMSLITKDLSEPYSVYTYRYFIHNWPKLSFLVSKFNLLMLNMSSKPQVCNGMLGETSLILLVFPAGMNRWLILHC